MPVARFAVPSFNHQKSDKILSMPKRFHIYRPAQEGQRSKRTTISLPNALAALLALALGRQPDTETAHAAVRSWLQDMTDQEWGSSCQGSDLSQWLQERAILYLVNEKQRNSYWDWFRSTANDKE